jgi:1,4-dihydroxy-2-naphthoate octaprenyltransferase
LYLGQIRSLALILLLISLVCTLWLGLIVGWPMLLFGAASLLLGITYSASPIRYGSRGWGLGESGLLIALGLLPAIAAMYAQGQTVDPLALWSGVPFAMMVSLIFATYNLVHFRRDWLIRKRTLAVTLGPARAIDLSTVLLIGAFAFFILSAIVTELPLRIMIALLALPIATSAYSDLDRESLPPDQAVRLHSAAIHATLAATLLYTLALVTSRLW